MSHDPSWEFRAPQFVDFLAIDSDTSTNSDSFFAVRGEEGEQEVEEWGPAPHAEPPSAPVQCAASAGHAAARAHSGRRGIVRSAPSKRLGRSTARLSLGSCSARARGRGARRGVVAVFRGQAEQMLRYQKATPLRFRSHSRLESSRRVEGSRPPQPFSPTRPAPFLLEGSRRMDERAAAWREGVEREQAEARRAQEFRASEATVLRLPPFVPRLEERAQVTACQGPQLRTDKRAVERRGFEEARREKEEQKEVEKIKEEEERWRAEASEVARLRKELVHKARPMPRFKALAKRVVESRRGATVASSPNLATKRIAEKGAGGK